MWQFLVAIAVLFVVSCGLFSLAHVAVLPVLTQMYHTFVLARMG